MKRHLSLAIALACSTVAPASAGGQDPAAHARLRMALYLGDWSFKAHGYDTPFQKAAEWSGVISGAWYPGHYGVVRNNEVTGPTGTASKVLQVLYYDKMAERYHLFELTDGGFAAVEDVSLSDTAIVAHHDQSIGGRSWHMRWTLTSVDPTHRHYLREYSSDGVTWLPCWESFETRRL